MMRKKLVIWGASGHARVVLEILRQNEKFDIVGFLDDVNLENDGQIIDGLKVIGGTGRIDELKRMGTTHAIIGIGDCVTRLRLARTALECGFELARAIHSHAFVSPSARIGAGSVIAAGAIISTGAEVGRNVIINTGATVDHECIIADGAHLGPGVHLGGRGVVGMGAWIGIGAVILDRICVGENSIVGGGALVTRNISENLVAYGVPAKIVRTLDEHRKRV